MVIVNYPAIAIIVVIAQKSGSLIDEWSGCYWKENKAQFGWRSRV